MTESELKKNWTLFLETKNKSNSKKHLQAKNKLIEHYYPYVGKIASKLAQKMGFAIHSEELKSFGLDGLYKCLYSYDIKHKTKFETFAYARIRGSMIDALRSDDWVPRSVRLRQQKIESAKDKLFVQHHKEDILEDEILEDAGFDPKEFHKNPNKFKANSMCSIDNFTTDDQDMAKKDLNESLTCKKNSSPESKLIRQEFINKLLGGNCTKTEQKVIYMYYYDEYPMKDIARFLNISESRISQIHKDVIARLKRTIEANPSYFDSSVLSTIVSCNDKGSVF